MPLRMTVGSIGKAHVMTLIKTLLFPSSILLLGSCAHLPNAQLGYYLTETSVKISAISTMACSSDDELYVATTITPSTSNSIPGDGSGHVEIDLSQLSGPFSDANAKLERYEDGRLKSWNSSTTGRGEEVIKSTMNIVALGTGGTIKLAGVSLSPCDLIRNRGKDETLTLSYSALLNLALPSQTLSPDPQSELYAKALGNALPSIIVKKKRLAKPKPPVSYVKKSDNEPVLQAMQPGLLYLDVDDSKNHHLWSGVVQVAQLGTPYEISIPTPALFGKLTLSASFAESGALSSIEYLDTNGANQLANSLTNIAKASSGETTADKVAEARNEADLILQQQRVVLCKASPTTCK
jgi:hypothetical protein